jgi:hypothetical protein
MDREKGYQGLATQEAFRHPAEIVQLSGFQVRVHIRKVTLGRDLNGVIVFILKHDFYQQCLCSSSALRQAAIDYDLCAGDVTRLFTGEEESCICDVPC